MYFLIRAVDKDFRQDAAADIFRGIRGSNSDFWSACGKWGLTTRQVAAAAAAAELVYSFGTSARQVLEACREWSPKNVGGHDAPYVKSNDKRLSYLLTQAEGAPKCAPEKIPAQKGGEGVGYHGWTDWASYAEGIASMPVSVIRLWAAREAARWLPEETAQAYAMIGCENKVVFTHVVIDAYKIGTHMAQHLTPTEAAAFGAEWFRMRKNECEVIALMEGYLDSLHEDALRRDVHPEELPVCPDWQQRIAAAVAERLRT